MEVNDGMNTKSTPCQRYRGGAPVMMLVPLMMLHIFNFLSVSFCLLLPPRVRLRTFAQVAWLFTDHELDNQALRSDVENREVSERRLALDQETTCAKASFITTSPCIGVTCWDLGGSHE